jgi:SET domain-containing protein
MNGTELFATMLLLNHMVSLKRSYFSVKNLPDNNLSLFNSLSGNTIAKGICTLQNLINHSCNPNTYVFKRNGEQVICAIHPIKTGEEVSVWKNFRL